MTTKNTPPILDEYTLKFFKIKTWFYILGYPFLLVLFAIIPYFLFFSLDEIKKNNYEFYLYLHEPWFSFIPFILIFTFFYIKRIRVETSMLSLYNSIIVVPLLISIISSFISIFYIGTDISIKVIDTIYFTLLIWGIIGGRYYYKRWNEYFKGVDGEYFKLELQENNYVCTLEKELKNFKLLKPDGKKGFFTKFEENPTISKIGLFIVLPIVSGLGGSGHMQGGTPYILVFLAIFLFPYLLKETMKNIVFYKFLKQIEKEENVTIYNGNIKPEDNPMEQMWKRYQ